MDTYSNQLIGNNSFLTLIMNVLTGEKSLEGHQAITIKMKAHVVLDLAITQLEIDLMFAKANMYTSNMHHSVSQQEETWKQPKCLSFKKGPDCRSSVD